MRILLAYLSLLISVLSLVIPSRLIADETVVITVPQFPIYPRFTPRQKKPWVPSRNNPLTGALHGKFDLGGGGTYGILFLDENGNVIGTSVHFPTGDGGFENFHYFDHYDPVGGPGGYSQRETPAGRVPVTDCDRYSAVRPDPALPDGGNPNQPVVHPIYDPDLPDSDLYRPRFNGPRPRVGISPRPRIRIRPGLGFGAGVNPIGVVGGAYGGMILDGIDQRREELGYRQNTPWKNLSERAARTFRQWWFDGEGNFNLEDWDDPYNNPYHPGYDNPRAWEEENGRNQNAPLRLIPTPCN